MCENIQVTNYCPDDGLAQPEAVTQQQPVPEVYIFRRPGTDEIVRVVFIDGKPWLVVSDICTVTRRPLRKIYNRMCTNSTTFLKCYISCIYIDRKRTGVLIPVSDAKRIIYKAFCYSRVTNTKEYLDWVVDEVITTVTTNEPSNLERATGYLAKISISNGIQLTKCARDSYECIDLSQIHIYRYPGNGTYIRTTMLDNSYYFVIDDIGKCIGYTNYLSSNITRTNKRYKQYTKTCYVCTRVKKEGTVTGSKVCFINYEGLKAYSWSSRFHKIHDLVKWLKHDLLPSLPKPKAQPEPTQPQQEQIEQPELIQHQAQPEPTQSNHTTETSTMANDILLAVQDILNKQYKQAKIQYTYPGEYYPIPKSSQKAESLEDTLDAISLEMGYGIKIDANKVKSWHEDMWDILNKREQAMDIVRAARKHE